MLSAQDNNQIEISENVKRLQETFIAVTSHKFLSPITVIKWNLELLLAENGIEEKSKEKLKDIQTNIQKLDDLTKILLRIYEVATSTPQLNYTKIDFSILINEVLKEFDLLIKQNNITIKNNLVPNIISEVPIDTFFIREILRSIIENAIHYNKVSGMVQIDLNHNDGFIELIISDTGIGIPEKEKGLIFNPFYRASNVLKLSFRGNGLRLYMAKLGLSLIGGKVTFHSKENNGSKFYIYLPIKKA